MYRDSFAREWPSWQKIAAVIVGFFAITLLIYGGSRSNEFVRWDDGMLIYENPAIRTIAPWSLKHIFTTYDPELYIPLTFLSYQIDYQIGGIDPTVYHVTNLILHTLNALLVACVAFFLLKQKGIAIFLGLLFAVHPLHTEAVEWASARKDVLSTFFFLASIVLYMRYRQGSGRAYIISIFCFLLGLMSKVMVITLPVVLLLIDWLEQRPWNRTLWKDKIPYVVLAVIFGIIGLYGKQGVVESTALSTKLLMAAKSAVFYLKQIVWPYPLSLLYPYTGEITIASPDFWVPILIIVGIVCLAIYSLKWTRDVVFALLFYIITVGPTFLNFAKGGDLDVYYASDRYAYVPSIGIFLLFGFLLVHFLVNLPRWRERLRLPLSISLVGILGVFGWMSYRQSFVWKDTESLFRNVLAHFPESSYVAHNNIGNVYRLDGDMEKAIVEYQEALKIRQHPKTLSNLGAAYRKLGRYDDALRVYQEALTLKADSPDAHFGLGIVLAETGRLDRAEEEYKEAIRLSPRNARIRANLGALYAAERRYDDAVKAYRDALVVDPYLPEAHYNLGVALVALQRYEEAIDSYEAAAMLDPADIATRINLGTTYYALGETDEAIRQFQMVLRINPNNATARSALRQLGVL